MTKIDYDNIQYNIGQWFKKRLEIFKFGLLGFIAFLFAWNQVFYVEDYIVLAANCVVVFVGLFFGRKLL